MKESDVQHKIKTELIASGWYVIKLIQTSLNGMPDLLCIRDGHVVFIEVKSEGGKLSELQRYRISKLVQQKMNVIIARNVNDIIHLCKN